MSNAIRIADEAHWHALRAQNVGCSELAALFDEHPQLSRYELWHIKAGNIPAPDLSDNERVFWGQILEPAIADGVKRQKGWSIRKVRRYMTHPTVKGLGGSLDYEIHSHERGAGVLDIKNTDWMVAKDWENGEPPLAYMLQIQGQLALTGRSWGALAVLVGGNDLRIFEFERRPKIIAAIEEAVNDFWAAIAEGRAPEPNYARDGGTISRLYSSVADAKAVDLSTDNHLAVLCAEYRDLSDQASVFEKQKKAIRAELLLKVVNALKPEGDEQIGTGARVVCGDFNISAWTVSEATVAFERKRFVDFRVNAKKVAKDIHS